MLRMLKYILPQNELDQLNELAQLKEQLVCLSNGLLANGVRSEPKLMSQLILASNHAMKLRT
jgi:hypothetical protein